MTNSDKNILLDPCHFSLNYEYIKKEAYFCPILPQKQSLGSPGFKSQWRGIIQFPNCKSKTFFLNAKEKKPSFPTEKAQHIF